MIQFTVTDWAAWAPGLSTPDQWRAWAQAPWLPQGDDTPALVEVPAMQRRRIERLGRMAIQAACWCEAAAGVDSAEPMVFASRHGDVARSMQLLQALAADEPLSPTAFGLSVHNAIGALYSISRMHRGNNLALAGGKATVETACVEAAGLLADGADSVQLVVYGAPLPDIYAEFADEPDPFFAWSWRLAAAGGDGAQLTLGWASATQQHAPIDAPQLPDALEMHRFLLAGDATLERVVQGQRWHWTRHG